MKLLLCVVLLCVAAAKSKECGVLPVYGFDPWFASLHTAGSLFHTHKCSGVLVSGRHVVTTASCVNTFKNRGSIEVAFGFVWHCYDGEQINVISYKVSRVQVHEQYPRDRLSDIALLTLDVAKDLNIVPACLPPRGEPILHEANVRFEGYRKEPTGASCLPSQEEYNVQILSKQECKAVTATDKAFCARLNSDTCYRDGGAPVLSNRSGRFILRGVTSYVTSTTCKNEQAVMTNVAYFVDWINQKMQN